MLWLPSEVLLRTLEPMFCHLLQVQLPALGTLCLPLQAPYDPATVAQATNISLAVCGTKLRCITWASVQGANGINVLEVKQLTPCSHQL